MLVRVARYGGDDPSRILIYGVDLMNELVIYKIEIDPECRHIDFIASDLKEEFRADGHKKPRQGFTQPYHEVGNSDHLRTNVSGIDLSVEDGNYVFYRLDSCSLRLVLNKVY